MPAFICTACGTQYAPTDTAPPRCIICDDERQYVPPRGQTFTTLAALAAGHLNGFRQHEPGVIGILASPSASARFCCAPAAAMACGTASP